ncbi:MAG: hypothetical protein LBO78_02865 [Rickettsiales bacterium]|jgi:hypothetical protein|nr:hypothetical protein [Rickettsiales bacterium]
MKKTMKDRGNDGEWEACAGMMIEGGGMTKGLCRYDGQGLWNEEAAGGQA